MRGAVASWLLHLNLNQAVWSPDRGHCVMLLGKTLNSHSASLHPGVYMCKWVLVNLMLGVIDPAMD